MTTTMTCKQLGGACDKKFHANTFEEMAELSKKHGVEMYRLGDEKHIKVMNKMRELMHDSKATKSWMESKRKEFDALQKDT
jgi:L-rhamnose mutarotase